jgi:hypothetical protein
MGNSLFTYPRSDIFSLHLESPRKSPRIPAPSSGTMQLRVYLRREFPPPSLFFVIFPFPWYHEIFPASRNFSHMRILRCITENPFLFFFVLQHRLRTIVEKIADYDQFSIVPPSVAPDKIPVSQVDYD